MGTERRLEERGNFVGYTEPGLTVQGTVVLGEHIYM